MLRTTASIDLKDLATNYKLNKQFVNETEVVVIDLRHLKTFISQAEANLGQKFDAVKIYFIRFDLNEDQDHIKKIPNKDLSQVSLAFVPARITDRVNWKAADSQGSGNKSVLFVCEPTQGTRSNDDETGMCPPKGPCEDDGRG